MIKFLTHKKIVLIGTVIIFIASIWAMQFVKKEFFPPSLRPEIIVDMYLPNGSSLKATENEAERLAKFLSTQADKIHHYSYYVGRSAPRFVLTLNPIADTDSYGQFVIVANDTETREILAAAIKTELADNYPNVKSNLRYIQTGPPSDYPIMLRVSAPTADQVKNIARQVAEKVAEDPNAVDVNLDWLEESKIMRLELDQDKLRAMGLSSQNVAQMIYTEITGATAAQFYTDDRTIDIDLRLSRRDTQELSKLKDMPIYLGKNYVPLSQIAKISFDAEDGLIKRVNLLPTITVQANVLSGTSNDATKKAFDATADLRADLPIGCKIEIGGALEYSQDSLKYLLVPIPAMIFIIMTLLMFQLRNGLQMLLTILTAPLGLIGVAWGMLLTDYALGFVAYLGVLALSGMIIRNSVILIDQIQKHIADGESQWDAIIDSAVLRFRPIMLTAAAAILGMIPLMPSTFWGPMAMAIASGLLVATVLTLLVLPTMYAAVYKVNKS